MRMRYDPKKNVVVGTVRDPDPRRRYRGEIALRGRPIADETVFYDRASVRLMRDADAWAEKEGFDKFQFAETGRKIRLRRVFQAPCPVRQPRRRGT